MAGTTGDLSSALAMGAEAFDGLRSLPYFPLGAFLCWPYAEALLESGEPRRARELLNAQLRGVTWDADYLPTIHRRIYELLTRSELAMGRVIEATRFAAAAAGVAEGCRPLAMPLVCAQRSAAAVGIAVASRKTGRSAATTGDTLTVRERAVADLVARNRTTPEIAAELYISPKTVETHLTHIFAKLGVSSRRALARTLHTGSLGHGQLSHQPDEEVLLRSHDEHRS